jgi:hypothetical protein
MQRPILSLRQMPLRIEMTQMKMEKMAKVQHQRVTVEALVAIATLSRLAREQQEWSANFVFQPQQPVTVELKTVVLMNSAI